MWVGMWAAWNKIAHDRTGGGSKAQPAQVIPAPAAPSVSQTAGESLQAQLQYNPQLVAQDVALQGQYGPQYAQQQYELQKQYTPLYRALLEQNFPQIGTLSSQVSQQLTSPSGLSPEQEAAQGAIRQRAYDESARGVREAANIGGTLFGGRSQLREDRARNELAQGFATEDINRQQQQRQQAMSELAMLFQLAGINVQNPTVNTYGQAPAAGGNSLYNALVQNQGNFGIIPGQQASPSPLWGLAGQTIGALGNYAGMSALACHVAEELYGMDDVRTFLARLYVGTHDSLFIRSYRKFSRLWASWLKRVPFMKPIVKPIWDRMWIRELEEIA